MFTGFASENTPSVKVWDFSKTFASSSSPCLISLADDCAPIQFFKTGASNQTETIKVYLPTAPIEGKTVSIVNARYGSFGQKIIVYASDARGGGTSAIAYTVGAGQQLNLFYTLTAISMSFGGNTSTGWISLNQGASSSENPFSFCYGYDNQATALASSALGGGNSTASGQYSSVVGGINNTASSSSSAVVGGESNTASSNLAVVVGGSTNIASGSYSGIVAGFDNRTQGNGAFVGGGYENYAEAEVSSVIGGRRGTARSIVGNAVLPASNNPITTARGVNQSALLILGRQTTDATATVLASNSSAAGTTNQVILPNNSAYFFTGQVIAGKTAAGDAKGWTVEGVIKRGANAASTALVGTATVTSLYADAGAATWSIAVTADTTNGGLAITVTGQASTTIRWVAQIRTTEMTY